jgi:hypothetical protein
MHLPAEAGSRGIDSVVKYRGGIAMSAQYAWLALLVALCIAGPYALRVRPRRRLDWIALTVTLAFLASLLGGFASLRSR